MVRHSAVAAMMDNPEIHKVNTLLASFGAEALCTGHADVYAWSFPNERPELESRCLSWLSVDEHARAQRFRCLQDRRAYVATRGGLRVLLGHFLGCDPAEVAILSTPHGKPYVVHECQARAPQFNVSHTAGYSTLALSWAGEVGVDIERIDLRVEHESLAERFFHADEKEFLRASPTNARAKAFFQLWVRKEALAKALGVGLGLDLSMHDLSGDHTNGTIIPARQEAAAPLRRWRLCDIAAPTGYCAALVHSHA
jgi:4'-phosphopantetheinyl transferase